MAEQASYLKNLKSESVVQKVINCLTDGMVSGELKPGDKLPTEPELAATLGVARTSVREATKILTYLGVLESRRSEGTFVANGFQESMIDPMVYGIILNKGEDFDSLMELRELTEVGILRLAIKKRSEEGLETIREKLDAFSDAVEQENLTAAFQADNDFHDAVSSLCQNDLVDKINRVVRVLTYAVRQKTVYIKAFSLILSQAILTSCQMKEIFSRSKKLHIPWGIVTRKMELNIYTTMTF